MASFNMAMFHRIFCVVSISPVIKDKQGNTSDSSSYRPIALYTLFAQLFEHVMLLEFGHLSSTDDLQFGFWGVGSRTGLGMSISLCSVFRIYWPFGQFLV